MIATNGRSDILATVFLALRVYQSGSRRRHHAARLGRFQHAGAV
jgi:hypothetical protein